MYLGLRAATVVLDMVSLSAAESVVGVVSLEVLRRLQNGGGEGILGASGARTAVEEGK